MTKITPSQSTLLDMKKWHICTGQLLKGALKSAHEGSQF